MSAASWAAAMQMSKAIRQVLEANSAPSGHLSELPDETLHDLVGIVGAYYGDLRNEEKRRKRRRR